MILKYTPFSSKNQQFFGDLPIFFKRLVSFFAAALDFALTKGDNIIK